MCGIIELLHSFFSNKKMTMMGKGNEVFCLSVVSGQIWLYKDRMARTEHHKYFKKLLFSHGK